MRLWLKRGEEEFEVDVEYTYTPGEEENIQGKSDDWYEGSPPEVDLLKVLDPDDRDILPDLSEEERKDLESRVIDEVESECYEPDGE